MEIIYILFFYRFEKLFGTDLVQKRVKIDGRLTTENGRCEILIKRMRVLQTMDLLALHDLESKYQHQYLTLHFTNN